MKPLAAALVAVLALSACSGAPGDGGSDRPSPETTAEGIPATPGSASSKASKSQRFDRLTMSLELRSHVVAPGGGIPSTVSVKNETNRHVTDPGCALYAYSYALVPAEQPDAELWGQVVVDCAGPFVLKAGYVDRYTGPTFRATDKFGDPLPVGEYLAVMEIQHRSERFAEPVTIAE